jgi:hypothetical protein
MTVLRKPAVVIRLGATAFFLTLPVLSSATTPIAFSGEVVRYECSTECFDPFRSVFDQATGVVPFEVIVNFDDEAGTFDRSYPTMFHWRGIVESVSVTFGEMTILYDDLSMFSYPGFAEVLDNVNLAGYPPRNLDIWRMDSGLPPPPSGQGLRLGWSVSLEVDSATNLINMNGVNTIPEPPDPSNISPESVYRSEFMWGRLDGRPGNVWALGKITSVREVSAPPGPVTIDIKPGSDTNCLNINGHGVIPVAVLSDETFDAADIDVTTVSFGGLDVRVRGNKWPLCSLEDVTNDGLNDLVCQFQDDPENWDVGEDDATLTGETIDGQAISGTDSICIVP